MKAEERLERLVAPGDGMLVIALAREAIALLRRTLAHIDDEHVCTGAMHGRCSCGRIEVWSDVVKFLDGEP